MKPLKIHLLWKDFSLIISRCFALQRAEWPHDENKKSVLKTTRQRDSWRSKFEQKGSNAESLKLSYRRKQFASKVRLSTSTTLKKNSNGVKSRKFASSPPKKKSFSGIKDKRDSLEKILISVLILMEVTPRLGGSAMNAFSPNTVFVLNRI